MENDEVSGRKFKDYLIPQAFMQFGVFWNMAIFSRLVDPQLVEKLLGGGINRAVFEHGLEAAAFPLLISSMLALSTFGKDNFDAAKNRRFQVIALSAYIPLYIAVQLISEIVFEPQFHHRGVQVEQLVATGVGLGLGLITQGVINRLTENSDRAHIGSPRLD
jgi:hypothetical protein